MTEPEEESWSLCSTTGCLEAQVEPGPRVWVAVGQPCEPAPAPAASDANFGQLVSACLVGVGWGTHRSGVSSVVSVRGKGGQ